MKIFDMDNTLLGEQVKKSQILPYSPLEIEADQTPSLKDFWAETLTWHERKIKAEAYITDQIEPDSSSLHLLAFQGKHDELENILNTESSDFYLEKDALGLSPLIYSIWGEINRRDRLKLTSLIIISHIHQYYDTLRRTYREEHAYSLKTFEETHGKKACDLFYYPTDLKLEYGHVLLHNIYPLLKISSLIKEDFSTSLQYVFESKQFIIKDPSESNSSICISVESKSVRCTDLILKFYIEILKQPKNKASKLIDEIENDLKYIISSGSKYTANLLYLLTQTQTKSLYCDPGSLPICKIFCHSDREVLEKSYDAFENVPGQKEFISTIIHNSILKLPAIAGSVNSIEFLQTLNSMQSLTIYKPPLIKFFIKYKWENLWKWILIENLMIWINIPLLILIIIGQGDSAYLILTFTAVNGVLAILEVVQIWSFGIFQHFGGADIKSTCVGMRFISLIMLFLVKIKIISYIVFSLFSIPLIKTDYSKNLSEYLIIILAFALYYGVYLGFVLDLSITIYLSIIEGSLLLLIMIIASYYYNKLSQYLKLSVASFQLTFIVILLCLGEYSLPIVVLSASVNYSALIPYAFIFYRKRKIKILYLVLDLVIAAGFSVNFFTSNIVVYYIVNSILGTLALCNCNVKYYKIITKRQTLNQKVKVVELVLTLQTLTLIVLNPSNSDYQYTYIYVINAFLTAFMWIAEVIYPSLLISNLYKFLFNWNMFDCIRLTLCVFWIIIFFTYPEYKGVTYALSVFTLLRGLTVFRCFSITRYYVRLIFNAFKDISSFLLIYFYSTLGFGIICSIYGENTINQIWMYPFDLNIGSASHPSDFGIYYFSFLAAVILNVIFMLNLLISILGDSFDKFQTQAAEIDIMEMTSVLTEVETMMFWRRRLEDDGAYLVACDLEFELEERWEGKIMTLKNDLQGIKDKIDNFENFAKKTEDNNAAIKKSLDSCERMLKRLVRD